MKKLTAFLLICMIPNMVLAGIGNIDNRRVVGWISDDIPEYLKENPDLALEKSEGKAKNIWNDDNYNKIVFIVAESINGSLYHGTGSWVSPRHILTNEHVVTDNVDLGGDGKKCGIGDKEDCKVVLSDGIIIKAKTILFGDRDTIKENPKLFSKDWAILEVSDSEYCNHNYYDEYIPTVVSNSDSWRAGFGGLRVLTDEDIENIKTAYLALLNKAAEIVAEKEGTNVEDYTDEIQELLQEGADIGGWEDTTIFSVFLDKFKELTGKDFEKDYLNDDFSLKYIDKCNVYEIEDYGLAWHNCNAWSGDSGSSIVDMSTNKISGLTAGGLSVIGYSSQRYDDAGPITQNIFNQSVLDVLNTAKEKCKEKESDVTDGGDGSSGSGSGVVEEPMGDNPPVVINNPGGGDGASGSGSGVVEEPVDNKPPVVINNPDGGDGSSGSGSPVLVFDNPPTITNDTSSTVFSDVDSFITKNFDKTSDWVQEDGSFNTARLISDSVSSVVLGTVGGVVTSVVIKNNQTKQGFESLKCVIGDRDVAVWGDEFKVGVQE